MSLEDDWKFELERDRGSLQAIEPGLPFPGPGAVAAADDQAQPEQSQAASAAKTAAKAAAGKILKKWLIGAALSTGLPAIGILLLVLFVAVVVVAVIKEACSGTLAQIASTLGAIPGIDCSNFK